MKWPTVEQTRAYFQMFIGAAIVIVLVYSVIGREVDPDGIIRILLALLGIERGVNGAALASKASNGNGGNGHT